jgi:hypothetical protein
MHSKRTSHSKRSCRLTLEGLEERAVPAGLITGVVFQDFNANGVRDLNNSIPTESGAGTAPLSNDRGLGGIVVTAYDKSNKIRGKVTTASDGTYSLNATGTGPYRIQFSKLPTGFFSGPQGIDSGTTVQFVPNGNSSNISLGVVRPADFSQDNPDLVTNMYTFGDQINGPNANQPVLISFPFSSGAVDGTSGEAPYQQPTGHALSIPANQMGTTWGLAYSRQSETVYAASFTKKFAGYGPSGNGAIYQTPSTGSSATLFADLNQIFGAGTTGINFRDTPAWIAQGGFFTDGFNTGWDAVGKSSLGGMDLSDDGRFLYVMNLADNRLYILPTSGPLNATTVRRVAVPNPITLANSTNPGLDFRPFAVEYHNGKVYVGAVNSAESTQNAANLRAFVFEFNPTTNAFKSAPVFQFALNYPRGIGNYFSLDGSGNSVSALWQPWSSTFRNLEVQPRPGFGAEPSTIYPQPWLTGLAFDVDGSLVLGLRDRTGDQVGVQTPDDPSNPDQLRRGIGTGDTLRASFNATTGTYTLENNGTVGGDTSAGAGNNEGPGGGEFYYEDLTPGLAAFPIVHADMSVGGVLQIPGIPDVATTTINPNRELGFFSRGGVRWFNNTDGGMERAYEAYYSGPVSQAAITFSKANGVGDLIALYDLPPVEIGNRIWFDANRNGIQDAHEQPISGVTVRLYDKAGQLLATALTDVDGTYYFSNDARGTTTENTVYGITGLTPNTSGYTVRLDNAADYASGGPLARYKLTKIVPAQAINSNGILVGRFPRANVSILGAGQNNHTIDFGFILPLPNQPISKRFLFARPI